METIRSIRISIQVETNKATYTTGLKGFDCVEDAEKYIRQTVAGIKGWDQ